MALAAGHGRRGATAQADQHGRAAQDNQVCARAVVALGDMFFADIAVTAGNHDGLVVPAHLVAPHAGDGHLKTAEVTADIGAAEFVVEGGAADRPLQHDVQGGHDPPGPAVVPLPGLRQAGNVQVGHGKPRQPHFRLGAPAHRTLVANLAAGAGAGAGIRRDRRGVVVGFHFHQQVNVFHRVAVLATVGIGVKTACTVAGDYRCIVRIGGQHVLAAALVGVADHAEQRVLLLLAVDTPAGIEYLVAAVLGIGLGEHHQFHIGGIAAQPGKAVQQVVDFVLRQGQSQGAVGCRQCGAPATQCVDGRQWRRRGMLEQLPGCCETVEHDFSHAVVDQCVHPGIPLGGQLRRQPQVPGHPALQPQDLVQAAIAGYIGGLAGPGRDRAGTGHHQAQGGTVQVCCRTAAEPRAVLQQVFQHREFRRGQGSTQFGEMDVLGVQQLDPRVDQGQFLRQLVAAEVR